jgi:carbon monoxide dehydrogenase subunit G
VKLHNEFTVPVSVEQAWDVLLDLERVAPCLPGAELYGSDGSEYRGQMTIKLGPVRSRFEGTVRIEQADAQARRAVMRAQARDDRGGGTAAATISTEMHSVADGTRVAVETDIQISGPAAQFGRGVMQDVSSKLIGRFAECLAEEMAGSGVTASPALGTNEATPAEVATGPQATTGATAPALDWAAAAIARRPTQLGGYDETPVGRLPTGPAGDSALAAAAVRDGQVSPRSRPARRSSDDVLDLGELSRGAVLKRAVPAVAGLAVVLGGLLAWRRLRRG